MLYKDYTSVGTGALTDATKALVTVSNEFVTMGKVPGSSDPMLEAELADIRLYLGIVCCVRFC